MMLSHHKAVFGLYDNLMPNAIMLLFLYELVLFLRSRRHLSVNDTQNGTRFKICFLKKSSRRTDPV